MTIIHNVSVDFINRDSIQVVNFVQHDQNIPVLSVDLYSGGSKLEINLSSVSAKIYLRVSLPNGMMFFLHMVLQKQSFSLPKKLQDRQNIRIEQVLLRLSL